ncbi:MAG: AAA family ATPase [Planctomycetaceae bacterium]|nr:AAA family ATPase [Planctomycetaceae bacterium]
MAQTTVEIDSLLRSLGRQREGQPVLDAAKLAAAVGQPPRPAAAPPAAAPAQADAAAASLEAPTRSGDGSFCPVAPKSLPEAGLQEPEVAGLILKFLYHRRADTGFRISQQLGLRLPVIEGLLRQMKQDRFVVYKGSAAGGDYVYELTEIGLEQARGLSEQCTYFGAAPVPLRQYVASVKAQTLSAAKPSLARIREAFTDLTMSEDLTSRVAQAIYAGRGMFLFGNAGNGKTSIASRITKAFGDAIWIPKSLGVSGEIIRLYDPNKHKEVPPDAQTAKHVDGRWVRIERPTIIVGGELRMDNLEIAYTRGSGIGEAPLQLKANCGTLLIDDFGRQRMEVDELLNRWIVPLEERHDFLYLESGRTIQVPFDELIVFSTNLEPRDLVEEAFLRRIPYKIEVMDPTDEQFRVLFVQLARSMGIECKQDEVNYLVDRHFKTTGRGMRFCHPRDILRQIENYCNVHDLPKVATTERLDVAVKNYFSIM